MKMPFAKNPVLFPPLCLLLFVLPSVASAQTCSPLVSEMTAYIPGNLYNYYVSESLATGDFPPFENHHWTFSFEVLSHYEKGDTTVLFVDGSVPPSLLFNNCYSASEIPDFTSEPDSLVIIDSVDHPLNTCHDSLAMIHIKGWDSIYTPVWIENDSIPVKYLGGIFYAFNDEGIFKDISWDMYYQFDETYAPGYGHISTSIHQDEYSCGIYLLSCVIDGQTTVFLTPEILEQETGTQYSIIYPNPANDMVGVQVAEPDLIENARLWSSTGQCLKQAVNPYPLDEIRFNVKDLPPGIYYLEVISGRSADIQKILIHH